MQRFKNIPAFKFAVLFSAGIIIGASVQFNFLFLSALLICLLVYTALIYKQTDNSVLFTALIFSCIVLFGIFKSNVDYFFIPANSIAEIQDTPKGKQCRITGTVKTIPEINDNKIRFLLKSEKISSGENISSIEGEIITTLRLEKDDTAGELSELKPGSKIILFGMISTPPGARNPGEFNYAEYLKIHNIHKQLTVFGVENVSIVSQNNLNFFDQYIIFPAKQFALNNIDKNLSGDEAAYLKGLVTGERGDLSDETKTAFINTGVMHLLAVSGLNVAYIIIILTALLTLLRIPSTARLLFIILSLIFYCYFTGNSPSIVRASIMGGLFLIALQVERKPDFYNIVGVSALFILLIDSKQLFDAGFILSFTAVITMVFIYERFKLLIEKLGESSPPGKKYIMYIIILVLTTLAAQIGTLPLTSIYFGKISFISLFANLLVVPLSNLTLGLGFLQIILGIFSGFLSSAVSYITFFFLWIQLTIINICASLSFAFIDFYGFNILSCILYFTSAAVLFTSNKKNIKARAVICILIFIIALIPGLEFKKNLVITYMDVGQGDCALIETPDGKNILVDCGPRTFNYDSGERTIAPYLKRKGISKIDYIVLTHPHLDHIGGAAYILNNFTVGEVITNGEEYTSSFSKSLDSLIEAQHIPAKVLHSGDIVKDVENARMYFLYPKNNLNYTENTEQDKNLNNNSVVFKLKYCDTEFLFTGDIENETEKVIAESYNSFLKTNILKAAHHGSISSSTLPFIINSKPDITVVSCGLYNKFNHPDQIVVDRLKQNGSLVYRTDLDNALVVESDGKEVKVVSWK